MVTPESRLVPTEAGRVAGDGLVESTLIPSKPNRMRHIEMMLSETGPYSVSIRTAWRGFHTAPESIKTQFLGDLHLIGNLLGIDDFAAMRVAVDNNTKAERLTGRVNRRALRIFKADYDKMDAKERVGKIESFAKIADAFINTFLRTGAWEPLSQWTDLKDEVQATHSITGLLGLMFNHPDRRIRFEAKRKLVLMELAATVDARSEELKEKDRSPRFIELLNEGFWYGVATPGSKRKTIKTGSVNVESHHDYATLASIGDPKEYSDAEEPLVRQRIEKHKPKPGGYHIRTSHFEQRYINYDGELIPVNQDSRQKSLLARIGKMIRKGEEDPAVAVQDTTGLMLVVRNRRDAYKLFDYFTRGGENGSLTIKVGDLEDTLSGEGEYSAESEGSSPKIRQFKFIATIEGLSIEVIIHTYATYLDNVLQDEVAHEEFDLKRYITAFRQIFPPEVYGIDPKDYIPEMIGYQRRSRRVSR